MERCQSGRMDRTRNAAYSYGYPGFESQSLRQRRVSVFFRLAEAG